MLTRWMRLVSVAKATEEYIAYKEQQQQIERFESIKQLDQDLKRIAARTNNRKKSDDGEILKK